MSLLITGVDLDGETVAVRCAGEVIDAVGPSVGPRPGDQAIDGRGHAIVAGLVNGHTHAAMTLLRGYGDDMALMEWLETRIWPAEKRLTADDVYWGTRLACLEMVRCGVTTFWDMYWHPAAVARAVVDSGLRAVVAGPLVDGGPDAAPDESVRACMEVDDAFAAVADLHPRVTAALGPHSIYAVSELSLRWTGTSSQEHDAPIQIHLGETEDEVAGCVARYGCRPVELVDRFGLLGPTTVLAHGCWFDDDELDLVAERGATIVTNPVSNMKLAVGRVFPYGAARGRGIPVGLGTDGAASNNSLDLLADVKTLALLQKHAAGDPTALPADEALAVATGRLSPLLGGHAIEPGAPADFFLVDTADVDLAGPGDLHANLVYAATGSVVDTTVVAGQVLMRDRRVAGADDVVAEASARARRVVGR